MENTFSMCNLSLTRISNSRRRYTPHRHILINVIYFIAVLFRLAHAIRTSKNLKVLDLAGSLLSDVGLASMVMALKETSVSHVYLGNNNITARSGIVLYQLVVRNLHLKHLDVSFNVIGDYGASTIGKAIAVSCHIDSLILEGNQIGAIGIQDISYGITLNHKLCVNTSAPPPSPQDTVTKPTPLLQLRLGGNLIDAQGAYFLSVMLKGNPSLQLLDLGFNRLQSDGARTVFEALFSNTHLLHLDIENNFLADDTATIMVRDDSVASGRLLLSTLILRDNYISVDDLRDIFLYSKDTLQVLDVGITHLLPSEFSSFIDLVIEMVNSCHLKVLSVDSNEFHDEHARGLITALNKRLCSFDIPHDYQLRRNSLIEQGFSEEEIYAVFTSLPRYFEIRSDNDYLSTYQRNFEKNRDIICENRKMEIECMAQ